MKLDGGVVPGSEAQAAFRGSVMRSYVEALRASGQLGRVRAAVSPEVQRMIDLLPTSSDWVPARITNGLLDAYQGIAGKDAVRTLARNANRGGLVRIIEPLVRTAMRLGGASPGALLSRLDLLLRQQQQGYEFRWSLLDARSGTLVITTHGTPETPASMASWEGALAIAFDLTDTPGTIHCDQIVPDGAGSTSSLTVRW